MRKWFKKVFKDIAPVKNKTSVDRLVFAMTTNQSPQYSHFNEREDQTLRELKSNQLQSTLNVPDVNDFPTNPSYVEHRTTIDEREGRITQFKTNRNDQSPSKSFKTKINGLQEKYTGFQYMGKDDYRGITAYWNGTEGDAGFPTHHVQVCVRVFNPNSRPPSWGHFVYRFLIGWDEDLQLLIDWLLHEEKTTLDDVRLEYVVFPGNVIKLKPGITARSLQIQQNSVLRFCHKFKLAP
uniref:Uncharacterized protein n=1 Tax=Strigamia maritima TaxID=126957 RepID=T1IZY2_STRMM